MLLQPVFPDAEAVVVALLGLPDNLALLATGTTPVTTLPPNFTTPVLQVHRVGGHTDLHTDMPTIVVQSYAPDVNGTGRATAWANALQVVQIVQAARRSVVNGTLIDRTDVAVGPQEVSYSPTVKRVTATYSFTFRRPLTQS